MARLHEIGYTVDEAIEEYISKNNRRLRNGKDLKFVEQVLVDLKSGSSLAQSMQAFQISPAVSSYLKVAEISGEMSICFQEVAQFYEEIGLLKSQLLRALTYPLFLVISNLLVLFFLRFTVIPQMEAFYKDLHVPISAFTEDIFASIHLTASLIPYVFLGVAVICLLIGVIRDHPVFKRMMHRLLLFLRIKSYRHYMNWSWQQSVSILLSAGIDLASSLHILVMPENNYFTRSISHDMLQKLQKGWTLNHTLETIHWVDPTLKEYVKIADRTGDYERAFQLSSEMMKIKLQIFWEKSPKLIEPIFLFASACLVGGVYLAMILPVYDLMNHAM